MCNSTRVPNDIKFFGINAKAKESLADTEETLRRFFFFFEEMKLSPEELDQISFERVHQIPTKQPSAIVIQNQDPLLPRNHSTRTSTLSTPNKYVHRYIILY